MLTIEEVVIDPQNLWIANDSLVTGKTKSPTPKDKPKDLSDPSIPKYNWGAMLNYTAIPSSFDSRYQWPGCIGQMVDEGYCWGSWAIAPASALSDRRCIETGYYYTLSPQYIIDCASNAYGCSGGTSVTAWNFLYSYGTAWYYCVPWTGTTDYCPGYCSDYSAIDYYWADTVYSYSGIESMQMAIMYGGPITTCCWMYEDFLVYQSGIYTYSYGDYVGVQCVKVFGWDVQYGVYYWKGVASFGTSWGMNGVFYFEMGQGLGFDYSAIAAAPW
jgi:cathepsin B